MNKKHPLVFKLRLILSLLVTLGAVAAGLLFKRYFPEELRQDFDRLSTEEYDSVFLSMYPIDNYDADSFNYWRGKNAAFTSHEIPNPFILEHYLSEIANTQLYVDTIYLGIRPDIISGEQLSELLLSYPQYQFYIFPAHPSLEYWTSLSAEACSNTLDAYRDCITALWEQPNASVYFWGNAEWLIANPANYESDYLTNADISSHLLHFEEFPEYCLDSSNGLDAIDALADIIEQHRDKPRQYVTLTDKRILFFGDSVIGNFTYSDSIPEVTGALTGAQAYNLGLGGTPATQPTSGGLNLNSIVNAFIAQDPSVLPAGSQAYLGLENFLTDTRNLSADSAAPYCFVINYGLNDYFLGLPISSEDSYDIGTFTGAFRIAIQNLRSAYPDARILVITPNFTIYFNHGTDTQSEYGHVLADYADALIALAEELDIELLDNFHELDINADNYTEFLSDGCHPNEAGRFLMGKRIAEKLSENETK